MRETAAGPRPATYARVAWRGWKAMPPLALVAVLALAVSTVPALRGDARPITAQRSEQALRQQMYLATMRLNAFIRREGRLPRDLAEAGVELDGVRFDRYKGRVYVLTADLPDGGRLVADSRSRPGTVLFAAVQR